VQVWCGGNLAGGIGGVGVVAIGDVDDIEEGRIVILELVILKLYWMRLFELLQNKY
jgi:hypothetical protein